MLVQTLRRTLLAGAALATLAGCDSTGNPDGLRLNVNDFQVAPGEQAVVVLDNNSSRSYSYGCPVLGQGDGDAFEPVNPMQICASILVSVPAGRAVALTVGIPAGLAEGPYRVRVGVGPETANRFVTSPAFRVFAPR